MSFSRTIKLAVGNILVFCLLYGILEISYSTYRYFFTDTLPDSFGAFEHPGETFQFDPVRGYFLTRVPSRVARVNHRKVEYEGSSHGNAQGFADRDDFSIHRANSNERRFAVFGDSFSSASMEPLNGPNWPDRVEDLTRSDKTPLVMLNFSIDGGGLANWASILKNIVVKDGYELDGIVFAIAWNDLDRKFAMFDQIGPRRFAHALAPTWDVDSQPKTRSEARALLEKDIDPAHRYVLTSSEFDALLAGRWKPREWQFRISARLATVFERFIKPEQPPADFEPGQVALINEIRELANAHSWPIVVAYIPNREELLDPESPAKSSIEKSRKFAEMLGATFLDGHEAFRGLSGEQIKSDWFPVDGHWNRGGSNQFADFMAEELGNGTRFEQGQSGSGRAEIAGQPALARH